MKKLKILYNNDPAAKKFLEDHPEFNDRFLEQTEVYTPGFNTAKGRYTLHDISEEQKQLGELMLEATRLLPDKSPHKILLEAYYEGATLAELCKQFKIKNANIMTQRISRAKNSALKNMVRCQQVRINEQIPAAVRTFKFQDSVKFIYLVKDEISDDYVWVKESGEVLPEHVQEILDTNPDFKEWDDILL